jgi:hypothetical protein
MSRLRLWSPHFLSRWVARLVGSCSNYSTTKGISARAMVRTIGFDSEFANPDHRGDRDDLRTPFPTWTGSLSTLWSQAAGKRGAGQQRQSGEPGRRLIEALLAEPPSCIPTTGLPGQTLESVPCVEAHKGAASREVRVLLSLVRRCAGREPSTALHLGFWLIVGGWLGTSRSNPSISSWII